MAEIEKVLNGQAKLPLKDGTSTLVRLAIARNTRELADGKTKTTRWAVVGKDDDAGIAADSIRLYLPIYGSYEPSDDELIRIFSGEIVRLDKMMTKAGKPYKNPEFIFNPWAKNTMTDSKTGDEIELKYTGHLDFAPYEKNDDSDEVGEW